MSPIRAVIARVEETVASINRCLEFAALALQLKRLSLRRSGDNLCRRDLDTDTFNVSSVTPSWAATSLSASGGVRSAAAATSSPRSAQCRPFGSRAYFSVKALHRSGKRLYREAALRKPSPLAIAFNGGGYSRCVKAAVSAFSMVSFEGKDARAGGVRALSAGSVSGICGHKESGPACGEPEGSYSQVRPATSRNNRPSGARAACSNAGRRWYMLRRGLICEVF